MTDLLLHNLRTIGTHHCDGEVGKEAADEIERLRAELATLRAERDGILAAYKAYMAENRPSRQLYEQHTTELRERAEKAEAERDDALVAVKAMHKLLDRDWAIVDRDITLRCESHDQAWNYLHEMRDLVRAALENVVPYKEPQP